MNDLRKHLTYCIFILGVIASSNAWPKTDCPSRSGNGIQSELEQLRTRIQANDSSIQTLKMDLTTAKRDISAIRAGRSSQLVLGSAEKNGFQQKVNGRGFRLRSFR
ncbi:MAG: hypothetical protein ACU841_08355 [Gammaproteobacteria bacterium]